MFSCLSMFGVTIAAALIALVVFSIKHFCEWCFAKRSDCDDRLIDHGLVTIGSITFPLNDIVLIEKISNLRVKVLVYGYGTLGHREIELTDDAALEAIEYFGLDAGDPFDVEVGRFSTEL